MNSINDKRILMNEVKNSPITKSIDGKFNYANEPDSNGVYKVNYTWVNLFGEEVQSCEKFKSEEDARKFREVVTPESRFELWEIFWHLKNLGLKH